MRPFISGCKSKGLFCIEQVGILRKLIAFLKGSAFLFFIKFLSKNDFLKLKKHPDNKKYAKTYKKYPDKMIHPDQYIHIEMVFDLMSNKYL